MGLCCNEASGRIYVERLDRRWQNREYDVCEGSAMHRRGLHKRSVHRWHGLAAILTMVTVRRAMHRLAALHGLFGRSHGRAVKRVDRESDRDQRRKKCPSKTHFNQVRRPPGRSQAAFRILAPPASQTQPVKD